MVSADLNETELVRSRSLEMINSIGDAVEQSFDTLSKTFHETFEHKVPTCGNCNLKVQADRETIKICECKKRKWSQAKGNDDCTGCSRQTKHLHALKQLGMWPTHKLFNMTLASFNHQTSKILPALVDFNAHICVPKEACPLVNSSTNLRDKILAVMKTMQGLNLEDLDRALKTSGC